MPTFGWWLKTPGIQTQTTAKTRGLKQVRAPSFFHISNTCWLSSNTQLCVLIFLAGWRRQLHRLD